MLAVDVAVGMAAAVGVGLLPMVLPVFALLCWLASAAVSITVAAAVPVAAACVAGGAAVVAALVDVVPASVVARTVVVVTIAGALSPQGLSSKVVVVAGG